MTIYKKYEVHVPCGTAHPTYCADLRTAIAQEINGMHNFYKSAYDERYYTLDPDTADLLEDDYDVTV